jgi:hypothetical protein
MVKEESKKKDKWYQEWSDGEYENIKKEQEVLADEDGGEE